MGKKCITVLKGLKVFKTFCSFKRRLDGCMDEDERRNLLTAACTTPDGSLQLSSFPYEQQRVKSSQDEAPEH